MAMHWFCSQEWEVYVLAKLNWNIPALVATDFVDHILKVSFVFSWVLIGHEEPSSYELRALQITFLQLIYNNRE